MAKKIAIVDDDSMVVAGMRILLKEAGYEVLGLIIREGGSREGFVYSDDLTQAADIVKEFMPDLVLWDYSFNVYFTGSELAKAAGVPKEKGVSISTTYRQEETCAHRLRVPKDRFWDRDIEDPHERARNKYYIDSFLKQIAELAGTT